MIRTAFPLIEKDGKISECPYCYLKDFANEKIIFKSRVELNGQCECGAWLDKGQQAVNINNYKEIYNGALRLIGQIVDQFNSILDFYDIEIPCDDDELPPNVFLRNQQIARELFISQGHTTLLNFMNALDIDEIGEEEWEIKGKDIEE